MATVHFSRGLARYTGGVESLTVDAPRVQELLVVVTERFPGLTQPLEVMAIAVDGEVHQHHDYLKLRPDSEIHFVPQIAGG
ncbi:MAG: MoaD/ThiS family protein [Gemmatimonadetes bacterium]|nr:MoaD/ThiS family protein [Gemmatimonadota bacterium]